MPIQIIMSEGLVSKRSAQVLHQQLGQAFLDNHEISDNRFMLPNIVGEVVFIDSELTFSGLAVSPLAIVELRVPAFTFATEVQKERFVSEATELVLSHTQGKLSKESIWVNAVYTVDGMWGIAGQAYTNAQLEQAIVNAK
ncbi:hypothetical protein [Pseudoalteromonas sp. OOF1S-7]|uniref:hypothetical protein n=1 Tax=Pseudoalteromonas sp. OOF1S-7 TaxID=2917757 RepID=UPI001EF4EB50|nr:hypothetical protein [Pseudoalteromonas sp. OOF1S-7]MCG7534440.1 hypothetical protein [Pseudoalteromonas sp. OOF1S-7]